MKAYRPSSRDGGEQNAFPDRKQLRRLLARLNGLAGVVLAVQGGHDIIIRLAVGAIESRATLTTSSDSDAVCVEMNLDHLETCIIEDLRGFLDARRTPCFRSPEPARGSIAVLRGESYACGQIEDTAGRLIAGLVEILKEPPFQLALASFEGGQEVLA